MGVLWEDTVGMEIGYGVEGTLFSPESKKAVSNPSVKNELGKKIKKDKF